MGTQMTLAQFIAKHRLSMRVEWEGSRPDKLMDGMHRHFRCTLRCLETSKRMTVHFSQGDAHFKEPTLAEVLSCLASDAAGWENSNGDFHQWCREYGYDDCDPDARKRARRIFDAVERQVRSLGNLVGYAYEDLIWKTETL